MTNPKNLIIESNDLNIDSDTLGNYSNIYNLHADSISEKYTGTYKRNYETYTIESTISISTSAGVNKMELIDKMFVLTAVRIAVDLGGIERFNRLARLDNRTALIEFHMFKMFIRDVFAGGMMVEHQQFGLVTKTISLLKRSSVVSVKSGNSIES